MISVTDILSYFTEPELLAWYLREGKVRCEKISQEALRVGIRVDQIIMGEVREQPEAWNNVDLPILNCLQAWQRFKEDHPLFVSTITGVQTELTDGEIVGHPDLEITEKERWGIVDVKTSKAIQPKHWTQVAAYLRLHPKYETDLTNNYFLAILRLV